MTGNKVEKSEDQQRLAAILVADAVGYSRLMSQDDRATVAALDTAREIFRASISASQGQVIDMAGDSVLAMFYSASGAVNAALLAQSQLQSNQVGISADKLMLFRIGIHLGDVIQKADGTVYGDGVNIAARLEGIARPGGITVSDAVRGAAQASVGADFVDQGEQQVKNIARPVRAFSVQTAHTSSTQIPEMPNAKASGVTGEIDLSLPDKPSIAVLPFTDMSNDSEVDYLSDGISEDIITELSRFHSIFVIARNSTFTYKGKLVDVRTIAKELGVRYVLEGSVRRAGNRIRVTAQLIDAITGNHIWAEKYDRVLEDVFDLQEQVTQAIVAEIAPHIELSETEKTRTKRPGNFTAYEIGVRAWAAAREGFGKADREARGQAIILADQALAIDPRCSAALRALAWAHWQHIYFNTTEAAAESLAAGLRAANRAVTIDYGDHVAHLWNGALLFLDGQHVAGLADVRRAHELNPNDSMTMCYLGFFEAVSGNPEIGIDYVDRGLRLSPRDPSRFLLYNCLAWANFAACEYATGAEWAQRSVGEAQNMPAAHLALVLNRIGMSDIERGRSDFKAMYELAPGLVDIRLSGHWNSSWPDYTKRALKFLRIAASLDEPDAAPTK